MSKKMISIVVIIILLGGIVAVVFQKNPAKAPSSDKSSSSSNAPNTADSSTKNQQDQQATTPVPTDKVDIKDFAYSPGTITVKKGTTVTWTNQDSTKHNVAPDTETGDFKASELLAKGQTYSVTFNTVGTFSYHCTPHPYMKAQVIVTE
jgi:amicyanin